MLVCRRRPGLRVALLAAAVLPAAVPAPAAGAPARALETIVQDDALLLHRPAAEVRATAQRLRALGADRVRLTASWSSLAPAADGPTRPEFDARDPAAYEQPRWAGLDEAVRAATAAGLRVMVDVGFWAPRWAADPTDEPRARTNVAPAHFADFAVAVARRYSGSFTPPAPPPGQAAPAPSQDASFLEMLLGGGPQRQAGPAGAAAAGPLPRADVLTLWNEPNHSGFLTPTWEKRGSRWEPASPHAYRAMTQAAYPAVKAARSDVTVLVGGTSATGGTSGRAPVPPLRFLREMACVDRRLRALRSPRCAGFRRVAGDGWAHHPYGLTGTPRSSGLPFQPDAVYVGDLRRLKTTLDRLAARGRIAGGLRNLWLTEMGWETLEGGPPRGVSQARQAQYLTWSEHEASRVPGVRSFAQFLLRDVPPARTAQSGSARRPLGQFTSGLELADGTPKQSAAAFRAGVFVESRPRRRAVAWVRLRLGGGQAQVALQRRADRGAWRTVKRLRMAASGARSVTVPSVAGARWRVVAMPAAREPVTGVEVPTVAPARRR
ncbi:MAG TPA: hypothetical protein VD931_08530 [Baekduia sp.]|nr:hypothetical protein [Baekduia sp.]